MTFFKKNLIYYEFYIACANKRQALKYFASLHESPNTGVTMNTVFLSAIMVVAITAANLQYLVI